MENKGRKITVMANGVLLASIDTSEAVAADYLIFMQAIAESLMHIESLESEANTSGRTIKHPNFGLFGSLPIKDPTGL